MQTISETMISLSIVVFFFFAIPISIAVLLNLRDKREDNE